MAKPPSLPRWATLGTKVEPSSTEKDNGNLSGALPSPTKFNWLQDVTYQWLKWVDDGAWEAVTLALSGAVSAASATLSGALSAASAAISGNTTIGGTSSVGGLLTALGGVLVGNNQHVQVQGTGKFLHPDRTITIPCSAFRATGNGAGTVTVAGIDRLPGLGGFASSVFPFYCNAPIYLPTGARLKTCTQAYKVGAGGNPMQPGCFRRNITTGTQETVAFGAPDNSGTVMETQTFDFQSGTYHVVESGWTYFVSVECTGNDNVVGDAHITYDVVA